MVGDRVGKCVNIGNCSLADKREPLVAKAGQDFICPECGKSLIAATAAVPGNPSRRREMFTVGGVALLLALAGGGFAMRSCSNAASVVKTDPVEPVRASPAPSVPPKAVDATPAVQSGDCSESHQRIGVCSPR